ncbi:ferredoxin [Streptomyces sp. NPDC051677]|uniref:ferredoxin n=1 Tax=Streptomyces sp. NPDC051677 TaxID=3365669 RepID=UPI0037D31B95
MSTDQHIDIDWTSGQAHGLCAELMPDHIPLDEWGCPLMQRTPVPSRTVKRARRAAADCPVLAMRLTQATTLPPPNHHP